MRTCLISRRDWVAEPVVAFAGGAWLTAFSVLSDPRPQTVMQARSTDPADTTFDVDLGVQRQIGIIHFQHLGVTQLAGMRVRAGNDAAFATNAFDTGWITAWPSDKAPFSNDAWGNLSITGTYDSDAYVAMGLPRFLIPATAFAARYIRVEINDPTAAQPAQIGVFGACETWTPIRSPGFGWGITPVDESDIITVPYGSRYIVRRLIRRRLSLGFSASLSETEVLTRVYDWAVMMGKSRPFIISVFPDDTPNIERRTIWGTLSNDPDITNPYFAQHSMPLQLDQLI